MYRLLRPIVVLTSFIHSFIDSLAVIVISVACVRPGLILLAFLYQVIPLFPSLVDLPQLAVRKDAPMTS